MASKLVPYFIAGEQEIACVPLLRAIGERSSISAKGDTAVARTLEFIQYAIAEHSVDLVLQLDAQLTAPVSSIELIGVVRGEHDRVAKDPWGIVVDSGPNIFHKIELVDGPDEMFVRGFVELMRDRRAEATTSFIAAKQLGSVRVDRWLAYLGVDVASIAPASLRARATIVSQVEKALETEEPKRIAAALVKLFTANETIAAQLLGEALGAALNGSAKQIACLEPFIERAEVVCGDVKTHDVATYNLACLAARLGDKAAMFVWLRATLAAGTDPKEPFVDNDFKPYLADRKFRALCPSTLIPWSDVRLWNMDTGKEVTEKERKAKLLQGFRKTGKVRNHFLLDPGLYDTEDEEEVALLAPVVAQIDWTGLDAR